MLEYLILNKYCKRIAAMARNKGRDESNAQFLLILLWIAGEGGVAFLAIVLLGSQIAKPAENEFLILLVYLAAIAGAALGAVLAFRIVARLPQGQVKPPDVQQLPSSPFARIKLVVAALLFLGWLGWLGYAVSRKGTVQIVSRAQLTAATHWAVVEVALGPDGLPLPKATVKETIHGEAIKGEIEVRNLPASATPLPVVGESRTPPAGLYLLPLVKVADGLYRNAGLPRSPGFEPQTPERPLIYPWNDDVKKQIEGK